MAFDTAWLKEMRQLIDGLSCLDLTSHTEFYLLKMPPRLLHRSKSIRA